MKKSTWLNSDKEEIKEPNTPSQNTTKEYFSNNVNKSNGNFSSRSCDKQEFSDIENKDFDPEILKNIPSYASVLNNPKQSNLMQWVYATTGERMESPKVPLPPKMSDYENYINKMKKSYNRYMKYHKKDNATGIKDRVIKKADAISAVNKVPEEFFKEDYRLQPESFKIANKKEFTARIDLWEDYLEMVENFLVAHVAENFDKFSQSFDNIRDMEQEMGEIKDAIIQVKEINEAK